MAWIFALLPGLPPDDANRGFYPMLWYIGQGRLYGTVEAVWYSGGCMVQWWPVQGAKSPPAR